MKPIVVRTKDDIHPDITLAEFNQYIQDAYDEGFKDGSKNYLTITNPVTPLPNIHWDTAPITPYDDKIIYCENNNTVKGDTIKNDTIRENYEVSL